MFTFGYAPHLDGVDVDAALGLFLKELADLSGSA